MKTPKEASREWRKRNPIKSKLGLVSWRLKNPEKRAAQNKRYYEESKKRDETKIRRKIYNRRAYLKRKEREKSNNN